MHYCCRDCGEVLTDENNKTRKPISVCDGCYDNRVKVVKIMETAHNNPAMMALFTRFQKSSKRKKWALKIIEEADN